MNRLNNNYPAKWLHRCALFIGVCATAANAPSDWHNAISGFRCVLPQ